jgi:hypothetical protein
MAKTKSYTKVGKIEKAFLIAGGSKKFEVELTTKDVSYISNALKCLSDSKLSFMTAKRKREVKKLFVFFDGLLEE